MVRFEKDRQTIALALSGGVDSAVAALRLLEAGFDVHPVFMKNYESLNEVAGACPWEEDYTSAKAVADFLNLRLQVWNFEREYRERVLDVCLKQYAAGLTPNPDVACNREIKFGVFLQRARAEGYDRIATGHYARIDRGSSGRPRLRRGADPEKDQSYFLCQIGEGDLAVTRFPVGDLTKATVRSIARHTGLPNADRGDSYGICFVGQIDIRAFLQRNVRCQPGPIVTTDGDVVGEHRGLPLYTIGQREGIGIGGFGVPLYVSEKMTATNTLVVAKGSRHEALYETSCTLADVRWIGPPPALPLLGAVQIRYRHPAVAARIESAPGGRLTVTFNEPQRAVTPGQIAAVFDGEVCLGGAMIERPGGLR